MIEDLNKQTIKIISDDIKFAFSNMLKVNQNRCSIQKLKICAQKYLDESNKMYGIGEYKIIKTKIPRKLKKRMKKQGQYVITIKKIDIIKNTKIEIGVV